MELCWAGVNNLVSCHTSIHFYASCHLSTEDFPFSFNLRSLVSFSTVLISNEMLSCRFRPHLNSMYTQYMTVEKSGSEWGIFPALISRQLSKHPPSPQLLLLYCHFFSVLSYMSCQLFILLDSLAFPVAYHFHKDVAIRATCQLA